MPFHNFFRKAWGFFPTVRTVDKWSIVEYFTDHHGVWATYSRASAGKRHGKASQGFVERLILAWNKVNSASHAEQPCREDRAVSAKWCLLCRKPYPTRVPWKTSSSWSVISNVRLGRIPEGSSFACHPHLVIRKICDSMYCIMKYVSTYAQND